MVWLELSLWFCVLLGHIMTCGPQIHPTLHSLAQNPLALDKENHYISQSHHSEEGILCLAKSVSGFLRARLSFRPWSAKETPAHSYQQ